jgi:hypothetical protein
VRVHYAWVVAGVAFLARTAAFLAAGGLALVAAVSMPLIRRAGRGVETPLPVPMS